MRTTLRALALIALIGGGIWIWHDSDQVEPYVTTVTLLAAFLATFAGKKDEAPIGGGPDLVAYIAEVGRLQHRLVFENRGDASAFDIHLELHLHAEQESPLISNDDSLPIREIYAHDERQILVALSFGSGTEFDATWSWKDASGRKHSRRNVISLRK
jgi:hypothetical protein